ncbi:hypothetical protein P3X46_006881 [Hevea brasiliensis]|uniref:RING-type E3 ubiquitin transferase n=1 Tax=Hevea brasiliensis TaxID=3981 RepID=A0ABQ9MU56_HEVBR|nr:probable E3 ubiquitin-protein ligase ZFP1 [Hevea brasiliensis]XP_021684397.2 probable E3 ubiquitin-protein ligase ZFP1 [Hevea brasiliensis]XP_021684398.2 probable E3 ubiquitin-protein ligase ZFP1 [Hevea brasiliensis]KAJ9182951.1 hypothetical protein P3X46_006881 [Hevea brasiliensis]KAJ9182952.1 hypothetical protein P3X46_006881 [Hevea brasiliensis]
MGQRNMLCTSQIDLEMDQQGQGYLHPEPCILLGGITNFPQPDIQTVATASGNTTNIDSRHLPEHYDNAIFYGMPQYPGVQHHPQHHVPNLDLGVATASNFYVPYMTPSSSIPLSHGSCDHLPSSTNYGVIGVSADEYGTNSHFMDNARGSYKRKNAEGNPGNFQYFNASASSSSSATSLNTRHPDGVALMDAASFTPPQYGGNSTSSVREVGSHRSVRNRLGATGLDPVLAHNQNHFIQGNYMSQPFQPSGSLWLDQQLSNTSSDAGTSAWTQNPAITYMHGNNFSRVDTGSMGPQRYHDLSGNRSNTSFLHPSPANLRHHNFHHLSLPIQGMRGHNLNVLPHVSATSFRGPTSYASQSNVNPSQDGMDIGVRHLGSIQPTGLRIYRPHHEGVISETAIRHRNVPHLRVLPTDGVAVLELPDYYEVENYVDHHSDMRLDIEDMSYEELLALGERIGNVNTGLSEETIRSQLKTRKYLSSPMSINLEETACMDQESDSCIICQDDYKHQEKIGTLDCGHEYHADCLKKWLHVKNVCPICKSEALTAERKDV